MNTSHLPRSRIEIEQIIVLIRLDLYNKGLSYGAKAILKKMDEYLVTPLPSISTINRILHKNGLTHRRTGHYD
jgi:putative transposase